MAIIKPFRAYRPVDSLVKYVAAPPYDVVNSEEARELVKDNKYSFLRVDRGEVNLPRDIYKYDNRVYECARDLLDNMINEGIYIQDEKPMFYIYRQIMNGKSQTGLVTCASIEEYIGNKIKKHENIRDDKGVDRVKHIKYCNAHTGPIFLVYREDKTITGIIEKYINLEPTYNFMADDNITHIVWKIDGDEDIKYIMESFHNIENLYIADGHHRIEAAARVAMENGRGYKKRDEINYFLAIAYPDTEVNVLDYNRTVKDLNGYTKEEFLKEISKKFRVEKSYGNKPISPERKHIFGMYIDKEWYELEANSEIIIKEINSESLDVSILQNNILGPILGIDDPKKSNRIEFIGGIRGLKELERRADTDMRVSFSLYPIEMSDIMSIADKGGIMPPKSTWFEPKPRSGIFIHKFN